MMHKRTLLIYTGFLLAGSVHAQAPRGIRNRPSFPTELKPLRLSLDPGLVNAAVRGEFRLAKNQSISGSLGIGLNLMDDEIAGNINQFNGYGKNVPSGGYVAMYGGLYSWVAFYTAAEYRFYFKTKAKTQFTGYPYINSGFYAALGARYSSKQLKTFTQASKSEKDFILPTTKYTLIVGFQKEMPGAPIAFDVGTGLGIYVNHDYSTTAPSWVLRAGLSFTLYSKTKK